MQKEGETARMPGRYWIKAVCRGERRGRRLALHLTRCKNYGKYQSDQSTHDPFRGMPNALRFSCGARGGSRATLANKDTARLRRAHAPVSYKCGLCRAGMHCFSIGAVITEPAHDKCCAARRLS